MPIDFEVLYQRAPCGYLSVDDDGVINLVNDTFIAWSGHDRAALIHTPLQDLLSVGDKILYATHCLPQLRITGTVAEILVHITGADGVGKPALLTASRTPADAGQPAATQVIVFGAHERHRYEQELVAALHRADQADARHANVEAIRAHEGTHDRLTGLLNRAGIQARLLGNTPPGLGVLCLNLDHFKAVNDGLGHAAGDQFLTAVAARLRSAAREAAMLARTSGDEFVLIDSIQGPGQAAALAQRLLDAVTAPITLDGVEVVISASIGIASAPLAADLGNSPEQLLRSATIAMYEAKAGGRNQWRLHDPDAADPAAGRLHLLGQLRHAAPEQQLRLHYQPQVALGTGRLTGVEALLRWQHPTRGLLPPAEFIEAAEESGLIGEIGTWVLNEAVRQAAVWNAPAADQRWAGLEIAVNLSTRQLADPRLAARIASVLACHDVPPALLTLEITETSLMNDPETALGNLKALDSLGVKLSIDDFGTGYASLTYLQKFPIHELKIDRSFVASFTDNPADAAIVASCVQLAHTLGIRTVAEGVETAEQLRALRELGCDTTQGYFHSPALSPQALATWHAGQVPAADKSRKQGSGPAPAGRALNFG